MASFKQVALALSLIPLCLAAQESPFHGGQWAMQFGGNSNVQSWGLEIHERALGVAPGFVQRGKCGQRDEHGQRWHVDQC